MDPHKRRRVGVVLLAGVLSLALVARVTRRTPPPRPSRAQTKSATFVHPIVPSEPVVNPPPPSCRARDLHGAVAVIKQLQQSVETRCRQDGSGPAAQTRIDLIAQSVSGCVARDAELDSQWNLAQSAVLALQGCADCAKERGARGTSCERVSQLAEQAEKGVP